MVSWCKQFQNRHSFVIQEETTLSTLKWSAISKPASEVVTRSADDICDFLTTQVSQLAQIERDTVEVTAPLADYGLDSLQIVELTGNLAEFTGKKLPESLAWEYPSISELSAYLGESA